MGEVTAYSEYEAPELSMKLTPLVSEEAANFNYNNFPLCK